VKTYTFVVPSCRLGETDRATLISRKREGISRVAVGKSRFDARCGSGVKGGEAAEGHP
jgi:hypothetical protein